jgi:UDP-N-acetyl-D-mannosaminuronate dehydrogenase
MLLQAIIKSSHLHGTTADTHEITAQERNGGFYRFEHDVRFILASCEAVEPDLSRPHRILLEFSTYPGTTDETT